MGKSVVITKTVAKSRTYKCPMVFERISDVELLVAYGKALKETINWVITSLSSHLFDRLEVSCEGKHTVISLWDMYTKFSVKEAPVINGVTVNKSVGSYVTREVLNEKSPLFGISTKDVIRHMEGELESNYFSRVPVAVSVINECVYNRVDGMMKGYVEKKMNKVKGSAKKDRTWGTICREVSRSKCENDIESRKLCYQLEKVGINVSTVLTGEMPECPKWNEKFSITVGSTKVPVSAPDMGSDQFISAYMECMERFVEAAKEGHPVLGRNALVSVPSASFDASGRDMGKYYDISGVLNQVPVLDKKHRVKVHIRMQSGHSDKYYPSDLGGLAASAKVSFRIPENWSEGLVGDGEKRVMVDAMCHIPVKVPENELGFSEEVSADDGIGIDLNEAGFFMNTTIPMNEISGGVDWIEAIRAFHEVNPGAWMFSDKAPARLRKEVLGLAGRDD